MADKKMIYDFETIFEVIMKSQTDMIELVTKWSEMISPTAKDVTFNLEGRDPLTVPNFEKMFETINTRTLPSDPSFNTVTVNAKGANGQGRMTAGGVSFGGNDNEMAGGVAAGVYSAYGTCGSIWQVSGEKTLNQWPIPRYWSVSAPGQAHVHVAPAKVERGKPQMSEFFVVVDGPDRSLKLTLTSYTHENYQNMTLNCPTGGAPAIWHVVVIATNQLPGMVVRGSASLLNKGA